MDTMVDVIKREPERRRRWPAALKRQIVAETLEPGASVSLVAPSRCECESLVQLAPATPGRHVDDDDRHHSDGAGADREVRPEKQRSAAETALAPRGTLEIDMPGGVKVRVSGVVDSGTLQQVLDLLGRP